MTEPPRIDGSRDKVVGMVNTGWMTEKSQFDARHRNIPQQQDWLQELPSLLFNGNRRLFARR
jgi:hypothetical protein